MNIISKIQKVFFKIDSGVERIENAFRNIPKAYKYIFATINFLITSNVLMWFMYTGWVEKPTEAAFTISFFIALLFIINVLGHIYLFTGKRVISIQQAGNITILNTICPFFVLALCSLYVGHEISTALGWIMFGMTIISMILNVGLVTQLAFKDQKVIISKL